VPFPPADVWRAMATQTATTSQLPTLGGSRWLAWLESRLAASGAAVIHFIAHGDYSREKSYLALADNADDPSGKHLSSFVGLSKLSEFLPRVKARALGLVTPPGNYSELGSRLLADSLARTNLTPTGLCTGGRQEAVEKMVAAL